MFVGCRVSSTGAPQMNGREIEALMKAIEDNVKLSRKQMQQETIRYIEQNREQIVRELVQSGATTIRTNLGNLSLTLDDLNAAAA